MNLEGNREKKIIISLTSYEGRFAELPICIKSLMNQTMKPDKIILYLDVNTKDSVITSDILNLQQYGLVIIKGVDNIKPHKKYYFAMSEFPDDIIITVDDDAIYDRNLVKSLFESYQKHPNAVSARRVHKIKMDSSGNILPYNDWEYEYVCDDIIVPSNLLVPTGIGGVLYPPHCLENEAFNIDNIKKYCLNADDIWLKCMQILKGTPVVWVKSNHVSPILLESSEQTPLGKMNVLENQNDLYLKNVMNIYNIPSKDFQDL